MEPASKPEEHNTVESLRGDVGADAPRIDSPSHRKRGVPAKRSFDSADRSVQSASFPQLEKLSTETHSANEGENSGAIWNGSRSYRHSSSFEIPVDNVRGRFQSFTGLDMQLPICDFSRFMTIAQLGVINPWMLSWTLMK
jgi:hypothetical protein